MAPLVTVITATWNSAALLRLSLTSLLAQDYANFEAWIVGDACTDDSEAVVASMGDQRLRWVNLATNSGASATPNNAGLDRATGDLVAYLGHDDLWFPWHLSGLVARWEETRADLVHGLAAILDRDGPCAAAGPPPPGRTYRDHYAPPSSWLHVREPPGGWGRWRNPDTLGEGVDTDLLRRAALAGARFAFEPRLSVLKFPSTFFRPYAPTGDPPEAPLLADMQQDPLALERRVLTDLVVASAQHPLQYKGRLTNHRQLLVRSLRTSFWQVAVDPFRESRVVEPVLRTLHQWRRRRRRRDRGLD